MTHASCSVVSVADTVLAEARSWGRGWRVLTPGIPDRGLHVVGPSGEDAA